MTRQRNDSHSTEFGLWLRLQSEIDSQLGYVTTNIDYLWRNYKTGDWMLIEEKRHGGQMSYSQSQMFAVIDRACSDEPHYHGFHLLVFENTSPEDGKMWLDKLEIDKIGLLDFLRFRK